MATANLVRSVFNGFLRKSSSYRAPVASRLSCIALQQKSYTINAAIKTFTCTSQPNGVSISNQYNVILRISFTLLLSFNL